MALDVGIRKVVQENINKTQIEKRDLMISLTNEGNAYFNDKSGNLIKITDILFINNEAELKTVEKYENKIYVNLENGLFYIYNKLNNNFVSSMNKIKDNFEQLGIRLDKQEKWKTITDSVVKMLMSTSTLNSKNLSTYSKRIGDVEQTVNKKVIHFSLNNVTKKGQMSSFVFLEVLNKMRIKLEKVLIQLNKPSDLKVGIYSSNIGAVNDEEIAVSEFNKDGLMYKLTNLNDLYILFNKNIYVKVNEIGNDEVTISVQLYFNVEQNDGSDVKVPEIKQPEVGTSTEESKPPQPEIVTDKPELKPVTPPVETTETGTGNTDISSNVDKPVTGDAKETEDISAKPSENSSKDSETDTEATVIEDVKDSEKEELKPEVVQPTPEVSTSDTTGIEKDTETTQPKTDTVAEPKETLDEKQKTDATDQPQSKPEGEREIQLDPSKPLVHTEEKTNQTDFKNPDEEKNNSSEGTVISETIDTTTK